MNIEKFERMRELVDAHRDAERMLNELVELTGDLFDDDDSTFDFTLGPRKLRVSFELALSIISEVRSHTSNKQAVIKEELESLGLRIP